VKHIKTTGIILGRIDYGEADRILSVLTPDQGKLRLMARGVRKVKSKLAGGIELLSTSNITFIAGRGEMGTLISTRLIRHYGQITKDLGRVQLGYEIIKMLDRATEDHPGPEYYELLEQAFAALDEPKIDADLIHAWFQAQLLKLAGHMPNLSALTESPKYNFDLEAMTFAPHDNGRYTMNHIKMLRLLFSSHTPADIAKVQGADHILADLAPLVRTMTQTHLH
jgi:DNA repair protein RecO (recombination protein O)